MARLFIGVRPPADVLAAVAELPRPDEPGVRWVPPEQWHITLRFLGEADVGDVLLAMEHVEAFPSPEVVLGPRVSRLGRSVVCLPATGLVHVASLVEVATAAIGQPPDQRSFHGHLTLARLRHRGACGLTGCRITVGFEAPTVELVESTLTSHGAQHEVLHRWTLAPRIDPIR